MLNEGKSAFGGKKLIGVILGLFLLITMASPALACRNKGCRHHEETENGYALAVTFCRNPEEPVSSAEALAQSSDGEATARAISIVIVNSGNASVKNAAIAIGNTNNQR